MAMGISLQSCTDRLFSSQFLAAAPKIMDLERSRYPKPPRFTLAQVAATINRLEEEMRVSTKSPLGTANQVLCLTCLVSFEV